MEYKLITSTTATGFLNLLNEASLEGFVISPVQPILNISLNNWTVVERKLQGADIYQLPDDGEKIITTLEINDMFLLGLSDDIFETNKNNNQFLSKYLYRVQKFTSGDYYFRFHLASTLNNPNEKKQINSFGLGKNGWLNLNPIKIKIDTVGKIKKC